MNDALFAFLVLVAALAVLFDIYGEAVLVGAFFIVLWQFAQFLGPSPVFAAFVIILAALVRIVIGGLYTGWDSDDHNQWLLTLIDEAITRRHDTPDRTGESRAWTERDTRTDHADDNER